MGYPSLAEIAAASKEWSFLTELPEHLHGFTKSLPLSIEGTELSLCVYENAPRRARVELSFNHTTMDYLLVHRLGLNCYRAIKFIKKDREVFAQLVSECLPQMLAEMEQPSLHRFDCIVRAKHIIEWEFGQELPERIGSFELYVKPAEAIEHINGSIILIDYTDFERQDQLLVYYNRLRDDFFAELKLANVFRNTKRFDSTNLEELQLKLTEFLRPTLAELSAEDHTL